MAPQKSIPASLAAKAATTALPGVAITATCRRIISAINAGRRSYWPSSQWYLALSYAERTIRELQKEGEYEPPGPMMIVMDEARGRSDIAILPRLRLAWPTAKRVLRGCP